MVTENDEASFSIDSQINNFIDMAMTQNGHLMSESLSVSLSPASTFPLHVPVLSR